MWSVIFGGLALALNLVFKLLGLKKKDAADAVAATDHAMLKDAVDRPGADAVADELRRDKF